MSTVDSARSVSGRVEIADRHDRTPAMLAVAVLAYAALVLWLTRETGFIFDELAFYERAGDLSPGSIVEPYNGHLIAFTTLVFEFSLAVFGPTHLPIQLGVIAASAATAVAVFVLIRPRLGSYPALVFALVVLVMGTTLVPILGSTVVFSQACALGLWAWVALSSEMVRRDVVACLLLIVAVLSFEVGLAFSVGALVWIGLDSPRQLRRLWVGLVPIGMYLAWYLWALQFDQGLASTSNLSMVSSYAADSLAAAAGALSGLAADLNAESLYLLDLGWGRILAVATVIVAAWSLLTRRPSRRDLQLIGAAAAVMAVLWVAGVLSSGELRGPDQARYAYPIAIALALVIAGALSGRLSSRAGIRVALVIALVSLPLNVWTLWQAGGAIEDGSEAASARLAAIELSAASVNPAYTEPLVLSGVTAAEYLAAVERLGSIATPFDELPSASPAARVAADATLARSMSQTLVPGEDGGSGCASIGAGSAADGFELPSGGAILRSEAGAEVNLSLARFADQFTIPVEQPLVPRVPQALELPTDASPVPWRLRAGSPIALEVCPLK